MPTYFQNMSCQDVFVFVFVLPSVSWLTQDQEIAQLCQEYCMTGRDGFEISGNGSARLCQSREQ